MNEIETGKDIKIFFDKNTWSDVANLPTDQKQQVMDGIRKAQKSYGLSISFTPVNLYELFKGAKDDKTFKLCQDELKIADSLTNIHLLENPWNHVRRSSVPLVGLMPPEVDSSFLPPISSITKATQYSEVEPWVTELRSKIVKFQKDWLVFTQETRQKIKEKMGTQGLQNLVSPDNKPKRLSELWRGFRLHFRLQEPEFAKLDWSTVYSELSLFRYWSQIQISYMDRLLLSNIPPKESDYFDIEQTIYFDIMDYLITDDKNLRTLVEETKEPELKGRVLRVGEFIQDILTLEKRAVCNASEKWIGLP